MKMRHIVIAILVSTSISVPSARQSQSRPEALDGVGLGTRRAIDELTTALLANQQAALV